MLLMPNRKKMVSVIIERMKPEYVQRMGERSPMPKMEMGEKVENDQSLALKDSMRKFLSAIERKDVDAMTESLCDFCYLMDAKEDVAEEKDEMMEY